MSDTSDAEPTDDSPQPGGLLLDRFRVERTIGRGGMGDVLLAHDTLLGRPVALKRIRPDPEQMRSVRSATLREARRASKVNDPHIASIHDVVELKDELLLVMEYVDGVTLRERMKRPLVLDDFWTLADQMIQGVSAAHAHGIVHRDIKPENLMVTRDGRVKILDFGIAKRAAGYETASTSHSSESSHRIAGTPAYMSPEAHLGSGIDAHTDIFGLGVVFYEMLTARHPFAAPTYAAMLHQLLNVEPAPVGEANPAAGKALSNLIARMIAKEPGERPAADALMAGLREARTTSPGPGTWAPTPAQGFMRTPQSVGPRRARMRRLVPVAAAIAIIAIAAFVWRATSAPALPAERNVALLPPAVSGTGDADHFALGFVDQLQRRLQAHAVTPGFQTAPVSDAIEDDVRSVADARTVLGANLALVSHVTLDPDELQARFELFDTVRNRRLALRTIEHPASKPFRFLDSAYSAVAGMLRLEPDGRDAAEVLGVTGAGTLRFYLQGIGRMLRTHTEADALAAVDDMSVACRTEADAAVPRAGLAAAEIGAYLMTKDRNWIDRAEASAREAVRLGDERPETHRVLARVHAARHEHEAALASWNRAVELDPTDDYSCLRRARTHARLGDAGKEREAYEAVVRARPHCWAPHWWLATWSFRQGDVAGAIEHYEEMIRRAPDLYKAYSSLGGVLALHGDYDRAIDVLQKSVALRPTKTAFDNLGTAYFNSGKLDDAIAAYNQAFQFGWANYESWVNLGDAYYWLRGRNDQAADAYRQAVRLAREEVVARRENGRSADVMIPAYLATVFPKLGEPDSARTYLSEALQDARTNPMVGYCAALTYWQLGEKDEAIRWLANSVSRGYPAVWLRDSPVFKEWQDYPGYRAILTGAALDTSSTAAFQEGVPPWPTNSSRSPWMQLASR